MSTEKIVLMARPHPFIMEPMSEFIQRNGYIPRSLTNLDELKRVAMVAVQGAVISLATVATIQESYLQVLQEIRKMFPKLPVVFATMGDAEQMAVSLTAIISTHIPGSTIVTIQSAETSIETLGSAATFLLVHLDDLKTPARAVKVDRLLQAHFQ